MVSTFDLLILKSDQFNCVPDCKFGEIRTRVCKNTFNTYHACMDAMTNRNEGIKAVKKADSTGCLDDSVFQPLEAIYHLPPAVPIAKTHMQRIKKVVTDVHNQKCREN